MVGVTLPGAPALVVGSTGKIAWGFTNSYVDVADLIELEVSTAADGKQRYRSASGPQTLAVRNEMIEVAGADAVAFTVLDSQWGPVQEVDGKLYAVSWLAHNPLAVNAELIRFEQAQSIDEAIALAAQAGVPPQNLAVVDQHGSAGWALLGAMPALAEGLDRRAALRWQDAQPFHLRGNTDFASVMRREELRPRIANPADGLIFTANSRVIDDAKWPQLADGSYALGARQAQIADGLRARGKHSEQDMLKIALDDRAVFLSRWHALLQRVTSDAGTAASADVQTIASLLTGWTGRAQPDNVAYRWVREFRASVHDLVIEGLLHPVRERYPDLELLRMRQLEAVVWQLLQEQPAHLLNPRYATYEALLRDAIAHAVERVRASYPGALAERTFSEFSHKPVAHPLTRAIPALSPYLNMSDVPLPGDAFMPRVTRKWGGSSERFAVSPGRESEAYFHMPGGQSGHPLSDFYRKGHADWVDGKLTPLLPGAAMHSLTLAPH
jgi:penicillin amidase